MQSKQQSIDVIGQLIERFDYHIKEYKAGIYNETQTRNDFINPFFEALGGILTIVPDLLKVIAKLFMKIG